MVYAVKECGKIHLHGPTVETERLRNGCCRKRFRDRNRWFYGESEP